jgi:putative ABC transport system ATP-binding protein
MNSTAATEELIIDVRGVTKAYEQGRIPALTGADLQVERGEFVALVGPSGCGKSTLLHLIAALDRPDAGTIRVAGHDLATTRELNHYRARDIGLIFQLHNLLPTLTASENVQVPMFEADYPGPERRERASRLLALVGLNGKDDQQPTELSGGERQRVAIARALANDPPILLADEPTGSLDSVAGQRILDLIAELRVQRGLTILMVTHDPNVAARADRIVRMLDGRIAGEGPSRPNMPVGFVSAPTAVESRGAAD